MLIGYHARHDDLCTGIADHPEIWLQERESQGEGERVRRVGRGGEGWREGERAGGRERGSGGRERGLEERGRERERERGRVSGMD